MTRKSTTGVLYRHARDCKNRETCTNNCSDSAEPWEAWVFDAKYVDPVTGTRGKKIRERFGSHAAAKGWRADALGQVRRRKLRAIDRASAQRTLREEVDEWLAGTRAGEIQTKRDTPYKPAVIRNYELSLRLRVLPTLGDRRFSDIGLGDLLALKEQLVGSGSSGSTVRNSFVPLQAIYRRARLQQRVLNDPTMDLPLPTAGRREKAATPEQAREILDAFDTARELLRWVDANGKEHEPDYRREVPIFATAFYAGLRRGELRALRVRDVDLEAAVLSVERGWDDVDGAIDPKSSAGRRAVFLLDALKPYLEPLVEGRGADELVFGAGPADPFDPRAVARKTERAWGAVDKARAAAADEAGEDPPAALELFTLHEARHSFSTWCDHAGISPDRADRYMGHSSGGVASRYRHLLPAQRDDDRARLDAYVSGVTAGKVVQLAAAG